MTSYAARVNLPGLTLEVSALVLPSYPAELHDDLPELCSIALRRFLQLVDRNAENHDRRENETQIMLDALRSAADSPAEVPTVVDPWGNENEVEPPC